MKPYINLWDESDNFFLKFGLFIFKIPFASGGSIYWILYSYLDLKKSQHHMHNLNLNIPQVTVAFEKIYLIPTELRICLSVPA